MSDLMEQDPEVGQAVRGEIERQQLHLVDCI